MKVRFAVPACGAAVMLLLTGCSLFDRLGGEPAAPGTVPEKPASPGTAGRVGVSAKTVVGRDESGVTHLLGRPGTVRNEPPAMVWQYAGTDCRFDVFFYFDVGNKDFRALAYKFTPEQKDASAERLCLASIRKDKSR